VTLYLTSFRLTNTFLNILCTVWMNIMYNADFMCGHMFIPRASQVILIKFGTEEPQWKYAPTPFVGDAYWSVITPSLYEPKI